MASYENNPVGTLQERFQSKCKGSRPQYKIVRAEGAAHAPTFSYQVILGDLATVGRGSSKKQLPEQCWISWRQEKIQLETIALLFLLRWRKRGEQKLGTL